MLELLLSLHLLFGVLIACNLIFDRKGRVVDTDGVLWTIVSLVVVIVLWPLLILAISCDSEKRKKYND